MDKEILDQLVDVVGKENASTEPVDLVCYSVDCYAIKKGVMPDVVLRPGSAEEVSGILKIANKFLIPVVPRASGSSLTGACVPTRKGIVLDVTRMNRILKVSRD